MAELVLAQLAREPVPGQVKTRLQPACTPQQAAELHSRMVEYVCTSLCRSELGRVELWVAGDPEAELFQRCRALGVASIEQQRGDDLGARMALICEQALSVADAVILVGSDAPAIDVEYLDAAVSALENYPVVVGPALDGGYVLLGMRQELPFLFTDMPWGSGEVLTETLDRLHAEAVDYHSLEALPDIDRPEDLRFLPDDIGWRKGL